MPSSTLALSCVCLPAHAPSLSLLLKSLCVCSFITCEVAVTRDQQVSSKPLNCLQQ